MASANVERLLENAVLSWLQDVSTHGQPFPGINWYHGDGSGDIHLPSISVQAHSGVEAIPNSGVWELALDVHLRVQADDTTVDNEQGLWDSLRQCLGSLDLPARLSALENFHAHGVVRNKQTTHQFQDRSWVKTYPLTVFCMPMDDPDNADAPSSSSSSSSSSTG